MTRATGLPLAGWSVVVTRAADQAPALADRLAALGARTVALPVLAVADPADGGVALAAAADRLVDGDYGWVALTSRNAVARLVAALGGRRPPATVRWAVVGPGTEAALVAAGLAADVVPATSRAAALADALADAATPSPGGGGGDRVLFPRAEEIAPGLEEGLAARGWAVDAVVAYRTVAHDPGEAARAEASAADAVAFASSSAVDRAVAALGAAGVPPRVVTIGPATTAAARAAGLAVTAEATEHTLDGLVDAVVAALRPDGGAGPVGGPVGGPAPGRA